MNIFLAIFTYLAYAFIFVMYTRKVVKYLRLPVHLRWELYPMPHEEKYHYGGSYFEDVDWWTKTRRKRFLKSIISFFKEYLYFESYFKKQKSYWIALYAFHIGSILLIAFQVLCFLSAIALVLGIRVSAESSDFTGRAFYYLILFTGVICFISGIFGSIGLSIKRLSDENLRFYASPAMYFGYSFNLLLFLSVFYAWYFADPTFSGYRQFWVGLITFSPAHVEPAWAIYIIFIALHLIYLPFTQVFHYISRIFVFFLIRWDDKPNLRGSNLEKEIERLLEQRVTWQGPHVRHGKSWRQNALEAIHQDQNGIRL